MEAVEWVSNWFQICHSYWQLAKDGKAPIITCADCEHPLAISWSHEHDDPVFYCVSCNAKSTPGLGILSQIKEAVEANIGRKL